MPYYQGDYYSSYQQLDEHLGLDHDDAASCHDCGLRFDYSMYGSSCDECGERFCDSCDERAEDCCRDSDDYDTDNPHVRPWNYRPSPFRPKGEYPGSALMGVELEVGGWTSRIVDAVRTFDDREDHLYMKEDGSISGVEIVTHPMTLDWAKTFPFTDMLTALTDAGSSIDDGYGLHIHVSRNAFRRAGQRSAPHQMAWLMFLYRNAIGIQRLARRPDSRWARWRDRGPGELRMKAHAPHSDDRYIAVNCNNEKTYEMRFFRSTLEPVEFWAALEFADASVEYTRGLKTPDILRGKALTWPHFTEWAEAQGTRYANLVAEFAIVDPFIANTGPKRVDPPRRRRARRSNSPYMARYDLADAVILAGRGGTVERAGYTYTVTEPHPVGRYDDAITDDRNGRSFGLGDMHPDGWAVVTTA